MLYMQGGGNQVPLFTEVCEKLLKIDYTRIASQVIKSIKGWHKIEITDDTIDQLLALLPLKCVET